jgi:hypothetical protein
MSTIKNLPKFINGREAREKWAKDLYIEEELNVNDYNKECGNIFKKEADIILDDSKRQTVIQALPLDKNEWNVICEKIYLIVKNKKIIKIGGTRNGMKNRFGSYLCGHHVCERGKSGKMSVTNAHLYHSIENDLLKNEITNIFEFYTWTLPIIKHTIIIFDIETTVISQTYHAYESCCINKYKKITGKFPIMCDNCDPTYN